MDNKSIMVAVDFGTTSDHALNAAIDLARRLGAPLDLVNVVPPVPLEAAEGKEPPAYLAEAEEEMAQLRARAEAAGVHTRTHVRSETVVFALLEAIAELDPLLVVVGSHGRSGVARVLMGSISESLARRSHVPVMIVPAPERTELAAVAAWSCKQCGYILGDSEASDSCAQCGAFPAHWLTATIGAEPADTGEPAVGEGAAMDVAPPDTQDGPSMFVTAPAGAYDRSTPNAEIRIRRF